MRERINRLARGIVDAELPKLFLSPVSVEETLGSGTIYKRELYLSSENNLYIKGLAYSDSSRVRILSQAFGGLRNHIAYEVDTTWCEDGDEIRGSINLVTNGGEVEIPFLFHVRMAASVQALTGLNTVDDFVELAQKDMDLALRLMEYRDFIEAPFLRDMHVRAVYEGLKGHGNRQNALEEFFLALGVKDPIELTLSTAGKKYEYSSEPISDKVVLRKNTWGYIYIEVRADGDFIELPKKVITQADFQEDRFELKYRIHPERLHRGKNLGAIRLLTVHGDTRIRLEVSGGTMESADSCEISKAGICRYLKERLDYESGLYEEAQVLNRMKKELDAIRGANGKTVLWSLFTAEYYLMAERGDQAALLLDDIRDQILEDREKDAVRYCFYQYLEYLVSPDDEKKDALMNLLARTQDAEEHFYLYFLQLKLEPEQMADGESLYGALKRHYRMGCHSPLLYILACRMFERDPELLQTVDAFEMHCFYYGARHGLMGRELALKLASMAPSARFFHRLHYRTMAMLYDVYPEKEILSAVCCLLIKGNCRKEECFHWYEKGILQEISLTRLYEYFIYSLPKDYDRQMPKQVLLYFSYEHSQLDRHSRSMLYRNILTYLDPESDLYRTYEREMEKFAMEQLFESRINSRLAVIYKKMIYRDIIDVQVAKVLPAILRSNRISCEDRSMKYVVVCNEAMTGEDAYPLHDGAAYVPLFFENSVILFQDMYGNRYMDVAYRKERVLEEPELEKRCFDVYPEHPMLRMAACQEIMKKDAMSEDDVMLLQKALDDLPMKPLYQQQILTRIIAFYKDQIRSEDEAMAEQGGAYLLRLNKKNLTRKERVGVCETLVSQNYFEEAYAMVREFGEEGIRTRKLLKLCTKMILRQYFDEDELLVHLAYRIFAEGKGDGVILDYLCEHFNGTNEQMYRILIQSVREHVETYDMEERLLAQLLFTGSDRHLDKVFDLYASRKKTADTVVKAYFTVKSVNYFLRDAVPGDKVFSYLEGALDSSPEIRKVPEIYLLALSKFYSGLPSLDEKQQKLCRRIMEVLTGNGMLFAYFKKLAPYADISGDVLDKEIIEYHGSQDVRPVLMIRVLPDEEEFHEEEMRMIYKGIYVRQKVLFEGEIMEYEIYEEENGVRVKKAEGEISCTEVPAGDRGNRFSCLNSMNLFLNTKEDGKLKDAMLRYVTDDLAAEKLFPLK